MWLAWTARGVYNAFVKLLNKVHKLYSSNLLNFLKSELLLQWTYVPARRNKSSHLLFPYIVTRVSHLFPFVHDDANAAVETRSAVSGKGRLTSFTWAMGMKVYASREKGDTSRQGALTHQRSSDIFHCLIMFEIFPFKNKAMVCKRVYIKTWSTGQPSTFYEHWVTASCHRKLFPNPMRSHVASLESHRKCDCSYFNLITNKIEESPHKVSPSLLATKMTSFH